jgi:hypothetical protein
MTNEAQRIAIAEACGWTDIRAQKIGNDHDLWGAKDGRRNRIPNYLNDLNAMHEAEKVLTEKQVRSYAFTLAQVLDTSPTVDLDDQFLNIHATASQRAEAFLRTLNLWNPSP